MTELQWIIEWSDKLSTLHPEIDAEHQHFIELVNELNNEIINKHRGDRVAVERIMGLLLEDAIAHFSSEERILTEKKYPDVQEHILIHADIINKFEQALETIQNTKIKALWIKTGLDIKSLMVNHLINEDVKYIEYVQAE